LRDELRSGVSELGDAVSGGRQYDGWMIRERVVSIKSGSVRYLESGAGRPLVLLHAFPLFSDMWRPQLEQPPEGWRLLAPDLRGFGPGAQGAAATIDDLAGDVDLWLDAMRIDTAAIGGLSMGGYVTLALFRRAPSRFTAMILANTKAAADTPEGRAARDQLSALVRAKGPSAVADQMIPKQLGETSRTTRPHLAPLVRTLIETNSADGIDGASQAMKGRPDSMDLLPRIACPALVIASDEDTLIPVSEGEAMHRLLQKSRFTTLPRAGHLSSLESPAEFSAALAAFLA
jgi:pimeloyl-ACP methyl ester carboxylesterase